MDFSDKYVLSGSENAQVKLCFFTVSFMHNNYKKSNKYRLTKHGLGGFTANK